MDEYLTVDEAAKRMGVSVATVRRKCQSSEIAAKKVGRGWLVEAAKLPSRRPATAPRRVASPSALVNFDRSIRHLRSQDLRRDIWVPDVLRYEDDLMASDLLKSSASERIDGLASYDPAITIPVPKSPFFLRNATNLSLVDRLAYHAVVESVVERIDSRLDAGVFSARLASGHQDRRLLKPGTECWVAWREAVTKEVESGSTWMVETDITSFFDCILHSVLIRELQDIGMDEQLIRALRSMLRTWCMTPDTGIPQGPDVSRVLANFYMHPIDAVISAMPGVRYFRYMDDIRIVGARKHDVVAALKVLDNECRSRNLYLSSKKTSLTQGDEATASLRERDIEEANYVFLHEPDGLVVRRKIKKLFQRALNQDGSIDSRRAKFSIYRLRRLREQGMVRRTLKSLEYLAPLGWLVPSYLLASLGKKFVQDGLAAYLLDPERNTSDYLSSWILAAMLDEPEAVNSDIASYVRLVGLDKSQSSYHRSLALNVLALVGTTRDVSDIEGIVSSEYDPVVVRAAIVALKRIGKLTKAIETRAERIPDTAITLTYLKGRNDLPSLIEAHRSNPIPYKPK